MAKVNWNKELVLGAILTELVGSLILTLAVFNSNNSPFVVLLVVIAVVLVFGKLSGGHVNPAVTVSMLVTKNISAIKAASYVVAQLLGAMLAFVIASKFLKSGDAASHVFTLFDLDTQPVPGGPPPHLPGMWRPIFGELVGALFFGFGIASATLEKKEGLDKAFTVGVTLLIGLVVALSGSYSVLNPAVALGVGAFASGNLQNWSIVAYGLAPLIGTSLGFWAYKLLQADIKKAIQK
jgi:glycerol uptake facilitator-like aquaporin